MPLPDASPVSGLVLLVGPYPPVIRPNSSGRIRFELRDGAGLPVPDYPVEFSIPPGSGDTAGARLSTERSLTDPSGKAVVEIIVGALASSDRPAVFAVQATSPGATPALANITVTTNTYSVEILPVSADDLLGSRLIVTTRLYFYDNSACGDLDIHDTVKLPAQARAPRDVPKNSSVISATFSGVAASGVHAVVGLGLDSAGVVRIAGCVDVPGAALLDSETIRATLVLDHLFPTLSGTYQVLSDFQLYPAPPALTTVRSAWQQWERCPFDPARLWIDCTIAALSTAADGSSCVPVAGAVGTLGDLLLASRGTVVAPPASTSDTPCHSATDSDGNPSLEYSVDALFAGARSALSGANLGAFSTELAGLLDDIRIDSQMTIAQADDANSYWVEHDLLAVTFPDALSPISFRAPTLGLPVVTAAGILTTLKADQLSIPDHGFTLRLGTSARYAFEATSLKSRNAADSAGMVKAVFELARWSDQGTALTGCDAMDAVACDQIKQPRGCLLAACQAGLTTLARNLALVFDSLDGDGLDFWLSGSTPVIDLDADGQADALGMAGSGPGLWSAESKARAGNYVAYGAWSAARVTKPP
jgi:hypothetical protein